MDKDEQEAIYTSAFSHYENGEYPAAADFFTHLVLCDPYSEKYWRGLASARQMEGKYEDALHAWSLSAIIAEGDPWPHFHAAECLLSLGNKSEASKALLEARRCNSKNDTELKGKIECLIRLTAQV